MYLPSSYKENQAELPLVLKQVSMPDWEIGICIPRELKPIDEITEHQFFNKTCPIESEETYKILYHVTYGLCASIQENDLGYILFCLILNSEMCLEVL